MISNVGINYILKLDVSDKIIALGSENFLKSCPYKIQTHSCELYLVSKTKTS